MWISGFNVPVLTWLAEAVDNWAVVTAITIVLVWLEEKRWEKIGKIAFSALLALVLSFLIKDVVAEARPCDILFAKIACPADFSFPSGHAIVVFTVAMAFLNKRSFPFYLAYALLVGLSRVYLGVHTISDIAGGLALAPFVYYMTDEIWKLLGWKKQ